MKNGLLSLTLTFSFSALSSSLPSFYPADPLKNSPPDALTPRSLYPTDPQKTGPPSSIARRDGIPARPSGVPDTSFHSLQFENLETTDYAPAVDAMPVWLYSRTMKINDPCYPEGGTNPKGTNKNPGTDGPHGTPEANPGDDCTDPGPYHGAYSLGDRFPVYVSAVKCGSDWRIDYDLYYVHDGITLMGHKHDWDSGVTMVWKEDPKNKDWFYRDTAIYHKHDWLDHFAWNELITVDVDTGGPTDVKDDMKGRNKKHPKVYVGFFSHAAFHTKDVSRLTNAGHSSETVADDEYRSDDWWRLPRREDIRSYNEINPDWDYGEATGTPQRHHEGMCTY